MPKTGTNTPPELDVGGILRDAREERGVSINSVAVQTNLRAEIIEKLENNDFAAIGAPVFTRGYLQIYARFLGVDEDLVNSGFSAASPKFRHEETLRLNSANIESQNKPYRRSMSRGWISLALVLLIGGGLIYQLVDDQSWLVQQIRGTFATQEDIDPPVTTAETDEVVTEAEEKPGFTVEVAQPGVNTPFAANNTSAENDDTIAAANEVAVPELSLSSLDELSGEAPLGDDLAGEGVLALESTDTKVPAAQAQADEAATTQRGITLKTNQQNWIEVKDNNGKVRYSKIYNAGDEIKLDDSGAPYSFNIGRPGEIVMTINGEQKSLDGYRMRGHTRMFKVGVSDD